MRYDLLHPKALRAALIESAGEDVVPTERQVRRWVTGDTPMPGWARRAIDQLMGTTKEAAEPEWVQRLEARLIDLRANQDRVAKLATQRAIEALAPPDLQRAADLHNERIEELRRQRAEDPHETPRSPDPADEARPAQ